MKLNLKCISTFLITALLLSYSSFISAQNISNGYVNLNKVMQAMPGYGDSVKHLDAIRLMYQNQYNYLLVDLQQKIKEYQSKKDSLAPMIANIKLQEIKQSQSNLDTFQAVANNALVMQQNETMKGFLAEIQVAVAEIGNQKHIGTIWDANMLKNAIWTDPKSDITNDVIQNILNKRNPQAPTPAKSGKNKKNK